MIHNNIIIDNIEQYLIHNENINLNIKNKEINNIILNKNKENENKNEKKLNLNKYLIHLNNNLVYFENYNLNLLDNFIINLILEFKEQSFPIIILNKNEKNENIEFYFNTYFIKNNYFIFKLTNSLIYVLIPYFLYGNFEKEFYYYYNQEKIYIYD